jgi:hypothetical protein
MTTNPATMDLSGAGSSASGAVAAVEHPWQRRLSWLLPLLLVLCVARLWLMPLPSSFWIDEMATVFVVRHGGADPSLKVAPQVAESIYYWLPRASEKMLGLSETVYRLPSVLVMGLALFLIARLAARLIRPQAVRDVPRHRDAGRRGLSRQNGPVTLPRPVTLNLNICGFWWSKTKNGSPTLCRAVSKAPATPWTWRTMAPRRSTWSTPPNTT